MPYFNALWQTLTAVWSVDYSYLPTLYQSGMAVAVSYTILFLAGIAFTLEKVFIMILNKEPKRKVIMMTLYSAFGFFVSVIMWMLTTYIIARIFFQDSKEFASVFFSMAPLAFAPALLLVFAIIPWIGIAIEWIIYGWIFLLLFIVVQGMLKLTFWDTVFSAGVGYVVLITIINMITKSFNQSKNKHALMHAEYKTLRDYTTNMSETLKKRYKKVLATHA